RDAGEGEGVRVGRERVLAEDLRARRVSGGEGGGRGLAELLGVSERARRVPARLSGGGALRDPIRLVEDQRPRHRRAGGRKDGDREGDTDLADASDPHGAPFFPPCGPGSAFGPVSPLFWALSGFLASSPFLPGAPLPAFLPKESRCCSA